MQTSKSGRDWFAKRAESGGKNREQALRCLDDSSGIANRYVTTEACAERRLEYTR